MERWLVIFHAKPSLVQNKRLTRQLHHKGVRDCNVYISMWCVMSVCFVMLCAWKASVYLSKRINSSLLTKIFNGIR